MKLGRKPTRLNEDKVREIKKLLKDGGLSQGQIAKRYGVVQSFICAIKQGKCWSEVE